ncbi:MAG: hypothetical protein AABX90_02860 [Nanoarchaeota archaeon]
MKEASWDDCIESNSALKVSPDKGRAKSLIETAEERISLVEEINEKIAILFLKTITLPF